MSHPHMDRNTDSDLSDLQCNKTEKKKSVKVQIRSLFLFCEYLDWCVFCFLQRLEFIDSILAVGPEVSAFDGNHQP